MFARLAWQVCRSRGVFCGWRRQDEVLGECGNLVGSRALRGPCGGGGRPGWKLVCCFFPPWPSNGLPSESFLITPPVSLPKLVEISPCSFRILCPRAVSRLLKYFPQNLESCRHIKTSPQPASHRDLHSTSSASFKNAGPVFRRFLNSSLSKSATPVVVS